MSSLSVDVLLLQPFTTYMTSNSSIGERNILFLFDSVHVSDIAIISKVMLSACKVRMML